MAATQIILENEADTRRLGKAIGAVLTVGDVVLLRGDLGAGKTTLARAVIAHCCGVDNAPSPTFSLVETYEAEGFSLWHFDFYRLKSPDDVWELGVEDAFDAAAAIIEWPDRAPAAIPEEALSVDIIPTDNARRVRLSATKSWSDRVPRITTLFENRHKH